MTDGNGGREMVLASDGGGGGGGGSVDELVSGLSCCW